MKSSTRLVLLACILAAAFAAGLAARRAVLSAQYDKYGRPLPFDMESALNFRYVRMLFETGSVPALDRNVQHPGGVLVRRTYETGPEYICAFLARFFPRGIPLDERVRWISAGWFCLGIGAMVLWLWWWQGSLWAAAAAGAYYALSIASVIRSTGEELSHENFAMPLLVSHCALAALAGRLRARRALMAGMAALSAAMLACALMLWDLVQFYILFLAILALARAVRGEYFRDGLQRLAWGLVLAALFAAGLLNPYLRAHGFIHSPAMLLAYGALLAVLAARWQDRDGRGFNFNPLRFLAPGAASRNAAASDLCSGRSLERQICREPDCQSGRKDGAEAFRALPAGCSGSKQIIELLLRLTVALLPLAAGLVFGRAYLQSYGHFTELLWAKIIFLNAKPSDPSELTFAQRILWTPALNSASFLLTRSLFPASLALFSFATVVFLFNPRWRQDPAIIGLFLFSFMSLTAFILFVRLHVFAAIAVAAVMGLTAAWAAGRRSVAARALLLLVLALGAAAEGANTVCNAERWGTGQPYLRQRLELVEWLKTNAPGQPVLANFGTSAFALAYAGSPVILHPKFESQGIRRLVEEYGTMLFKADEARFRAWADRHGAAFYIHGMGEFADIHPEGQMRYFVDALNPPPAAPARIFEFSPESARWFVLLWGNVKYRVFRVITSADEQAAAERVAAAQFKIARGYLRQAENDARLALLYDPGNEAAREAIVRIAALEKKK